MDDDFLEDYVAFEFVEEATCQQTDVDCLKCSSKLLYAADRALYLCPDCRAEFKESTE
jgi:transposase-like protein